MIQTAKNTGHMIQTARMEFNGTLNGVNIKDSGAGILKHTSIAHAQLTTNYTWHKVSACAVNYTWHKVSACAVDYQRHMAQFSPYGLQQKVQLVQLVN